MPNRKLHGREGLPALPVRLHAASGCTDASKIVSLTYNEFRRETIAVNERGFARHIFFDQYGNSVKIVEENCGERIYTYYAPTYP